jgi:hypothetical protein
MESYVITVMLCTAACGNKVPQYIILNRQTAQKENFCEDVNVEVQKIAWMTSEMMKDWLGCVWEHWPSVLSKPQSMLAVDAFQCHLCDRFRSNLRNKDTDPVIIPSGMTTT